MADLGFDKSTLSWTLPWDADWVTAVAFLGSTRRLAAGNNLGEILLWELPDKPDGATPSPVRRLDGHSNAINRLVATADGRWLISASNDHTIRYWDMEAPVTDSVDLVLNATAIREAEARRRNGAKVPPPIPARVQVQPAVRVLEGHREWVLGLCLSKDEQFLLAGDDGSKVILWDRVAGKEVRRWQTNGWVYSVALSPDNKQAFVSERRPLVFDSGRLAAARLWDATTGQVQKELTDDYKKMYLSASAYSPDGKILAIARGGETGGMDGKVWLLDPATGKKRRELTPSHQYGVTDLVFHPDGKHLASCGRDTLVRIWNTADGKLVKELGKSRGGQFKDWIHAISFTADGRWLAAADMAGAVQVWHFA